MTTVTTVGYGDYYAKSVIEKWYVMFMEVSGIMIFSVITGNITGLRSDKSVLDVVKEK